VNGAAPGGAAFDDPEVMTMASARRKSAGGKAAKKSKPAAKAKAHAKSKPAAKAKRAAKAKPAPGRKPAARPVKAARPAKAVKAAKAHARPAPKPAAKSPARPAPKTPAKAAVKPAPPAKPVRTGPPRLVPATAEARLRAVKPVTGKAKASTRPPAEVRPLGVLPPESIAKPRHAPPRPAVAPARPVASAAPKAVPPRKGDERLSPDDLKHFETRLLSERVRIMREMGHLESTILKVNPRDSAGELSGYSFHMADAGTDSMEREKAFDIASKEGRLLMEIDDALRRLYGGTYGICEASGKPISRARLEALPWARLSLEEQEKLEKEQRAGRLAPGAE
jgi:DnaK suppressor protein